MKALVIALTLVLAGAITGCTDSQTTEPQADLTGITTGKPAPTRQVIPFNVVLRDPSQAFNTFIEVSGAVTYEIQKGSAMPGRFYAVNLTTEARLSPFGSEKVHWSVTATSSETLWLSEKDEDQGFVQMHKAYRVKGRNDGLALNIAFRVTEKEMSITGIWFTKNPVRTYVDVTN